MTVLAWFVIGMSLIMIGVLIDSVTKYRSNLSEIFMLIGGLVILASVCIYFIKLIAAIFVI